MSDINTTTRLRRKTAAEWTDLNPTLLRGEMVLEKDTGLLKVGDGETKYISLGYVGGLASTGLIDEAALPPVSTTEVFTVADEAAMLALTAQGGDMAIRSDTDRVYVLGSSPATVLANWKLLPDASGAVTSVNTQTGDVVLTKSDIGLSNADNTSDANKPVSTAAQTAIDLKANNANPAMTGDGTIVGFFKAMALAIQFGTNDALARPQIWNKLTNAVLRLGSWGADGDVENVNSEGIVVYGASLTDTPLGAADGGYARVKKDRFGLFTIDSTLPAYTGGDYYFRTDATEMFYKDNSATKTFRVIRSSGNITTPGLISASSMAIGASAPSTSVALEITSSTGALLLPRMTTAQRDALTPLAGMIIFNTTTTAINVYNGTTWKTVVEV